MPIRERGSKIITTYTCDGCGLEGKEANGSRKECVPPQDWVEAHISAITPDRVDPPAWNSRPSTFIWSCFAGVSEKSGELLYCPTCYKSKLEPVLKDSAWWG